MLTGAFYPEISGAGLQCLTVCRSLASQFDFYVITTTCDPDLPATDRLDDIRIQRIYINPDQTVSKLGALWKYWRAFWQIKNKIQIIHHHGFSDKTLFSILLARLYGIKILHKFTSAGDDDPVSISKRTLGQIKLWFLSRSDAFVSPSPALDALIRRSTLPACQIHSIANAVDCQRFQPVRHPQQKRDIRLKLNLPETRQLILFVGFFSRDKAPDVAYQAWKNLTPSLQDTTDLVFIGSQNTHYYEISHDLIDQIHQDIELNGFQSRVHFIEKTLMIETYYQACDVFVFPSRREGLPNALLEAMACAMPCVVNHLPGITDHLIRPPENGLIMADPTHVSLTVCLEELLKNDQTASRMGQKARETILNQYSISHIAQQYAGLYYHLMTI